MFRIRHIEPIVPVHHTFLPPYVSPALAEGCLCYSADALKKRTEKAPLAIRKRGPLVIRTTSYVLAFELLMRAERLNAAD